MPTYDPTEGLNSSPAEILRQYLISQSLGAAYASVTTDWAAFFSKWPGEEVSDNCIVLFDTEPKSVGQLQNQGEFCSHRGLMIQVRSGLYNVGWAKINTINEALKSVTNTRLVVSGYDYIIDSITHASGPFHLGYESPQSKRELFSLNLTVAITQLIATLP